MIDLPKLPVPAILAKLDDARRDAERAGAADLLIAFDADNTIWRGDVGVDLFEALLRDDAVRPLAAAALARMADTWRIGVGEPPVEIARALYASWEKDLTPRCPEDATFAMMAWIYAGFTEAELFDYARAVLERAGIRDRIRGAVREIVAWARRSGVDVVVASASPRQPVIVGVESLEIPENKVFAMVQRVEAGVLQPELTGVFVYAEGKAEAIRTHRPNATVLGAFGDSAYDGALLRLAAVPVAIEPGKSLRAAAHTIPGLVEIEGA